MSTNPNPVSLLTQLSEAEARVEQLRREVAAGPCREFGHDWQSSGGRNAGCAPDCCCSVPVNICTKCTDCDYGENDEARAVVRQCEEDRRP